MLSLDDRLSLKIILHLDSCTTACRCGKENRSDISLEDNKRKKEDLFLQHVVSYSISSHLFHFLHHHSVPIPILSTHPRPTLSNIQPQPPRQLPTQRHLQEQLSSQTPRHFNKCLAANPSSSHSALQTPQCFSDSSFVGLEIPKLSCGNGGSDKHIIDGWLWCGLRFGDDAVAG